MAQLTKQEKKARKKIAEATRAILVERYPRCFCKKGAPKTPLKVGIFHDIRKAEPDISRRELRFALADYTSGRTYKRQLVAGASRVDLEGHPSGTVTAEEAADAAEKLIRSARYQTEAPNA